MSKALNLRFIFLIISLSISILFGGGYFEYISCIINIILLLYILVFFVKNNEFKLRFDYNLLILTIISFFYALVCLWALDKKFALLGFFKFFPVVIWYIIISGSDDIKEKIIDSLPLIGSLMTIFTFTMSFFDVFKSRVLVAGRLAGTFQYPNTFALFLLICLIITIRKKDWTDILYAFILLSGICLSGSRTVMVLTLLTIILISVFNKKTRKLSIIGLFVVLCGAVLLLSMHKINLSLSTFYGRFLYYKDALKIILKHPFGLGYYGYFFIQTSVQTGVYSVVNVHNELLQFILDIGVIPALLFYVLLIRPLFTDRDSLRNRLVLLVIVLHSLFDYDFQFISIFFITIIFIRPWTKNNKKSEPIKYGILSKVILSAVSAIIIYGSVIMGMSMYLYNHGEYKKAFNIGKFNTPAEIRMMNEEDDIDAMDKVADDIILRNKYIPNSYSIKALAAYNNGDIESFIKYKQKAIKTAPYNYVEYIDYLDKLIYVCNIYISSDDIDSAEICIKRIKNVPVMLSDLAESTDELAWKIDDLPQLSLPVEYINAIDELEVILDEK